MHHIKTYISHAQRLVIELKKYQAVSTHFFSFACATILIRSISLISAPLTMLVLTPEDYGLLALANSFISMLCAVLGLGLRQALPFYYFRYTEPGRILLLRKVSAVYASVAGVISVITLCNMHRCNDYFFLSHANMSIIAISLCIAFFYFFVELAYQLLHYKQEAWALAKLQMCTALITIACNLFFLCILRLGPISILLGQAVGMFFVLCRHAPFFYNLANKPLEPEYTCVSMKTYIAQGLPFIPSMLCGVLLASGDRWALAHISTLHNVGIYSLANTLAQCANMMILYALSGSYMPYLLKKFNEQPENILLLEKENKRIMVICMLAGSIVLCVGFGIVKPVLFYIPIKFREAINYMGILLIGSIFYLGTQFLNCLMQYKHKSIFLGFVLCIPALLNICLNLLLIPMCGLYGCVVATLIAYIIYFLITLWYNRRLCNSQQ